MRLSKGDIFLNSIPVGMGYITLGITFGVLFSEKGGSVFESLVISMFCFAGAAQFISLKFYNPGFSVFSLFFIILLINFRHVIYSFCIMPLLQKNSYRFYLISTLTDENYGISKLYRAPYDNFSLFKIFLLNHLYWIVGCTVGAIYGKEIQLIKGAEFMLTALFITLLANTICKERNEA